MTYLRVCLNRSTDKNQSILCTLSTKTLPKSSMFADILPSHHGGKNTAVRLRESLSLSTDQHFPSDATNTIKIKVFSSVFSRAISIISVLKGFLFSFSNKTNRRFESVALINVVASIELVAPCVLAPYRAASEKLLKGAIHP